jgi:hypothetical protein
MAEDIYENDSNSFSKEHLEDALTAITSLASKCEKSQSKITHRTAQATLLINRIRALNIAAILISKELENKNMNL